MKGRPINPPASFFARGCLILLPVLVLAVIGFYSLRQDLRMIEADAKDQAHQLARDWLETISTEWAGVENAATNRQSLDSLPLGQGSAGLFFALDSDGRLVFPPPYDAVPVPQPLVPAALTPSQAQLWNTALKVESRAVGADSVTGVYQQFLDTAPPPRFAASARYTLSFWLTQAGKYSDAEKVWRSIGEDFPAEISESGIPLRHLAQLQWLESGELTPVTLAMIRSNAVYQPSLLTPQLLDRADRAKEKMLPQVAIQDDYRTIWSRHESTRKLCQAMKLQLSSGTGQAVRVPPACIVQLDKPFAIVRLSAANVAPTKLLALPAGEAPLSPARQADLSDRRRDVFGVTVSLAGLITSQEGFPESATSQVGKTDQGLADQADWPVLAAAAKTQDGSEVLKIHVHLANSTLFYGRHRQRTVWLAAIIASASAAAVLGWIAMRRAFRRQQQLNELKTNFVSSVSHELRAPIASVRLLAEGLESGRIKDETKKHEYFKFIVQECRRLSSLIENVLDFSRIEQGRKQYEFEPTDVSTLIQGTAKLMEPYAAERQIRLETNFDNSQPSTLNSQPSLDGRAIQQALVNLIDNAIKHSPKGSSVTVGLEFPTSDANSRLTDHALRSNASRSTTPPFHLWVEDHGEGIPSEEHERIFERFYRLGSELRRETQGVGIGLSIVKHIVEAHGGRVIVRSAVGQGSRFTMELPINQKVERETSGKP